MFSSDNISISKTTGENSQQVRIASKDTVFYHKATDGQKTIDLLALVMPAEINDAQATPEQLAAAQLYTNRKSLRLLSSIRKELVLGLDYDVTSSTSIQLKGGYLESGAFADEVFVGRIVGTPISNLTAASAKSVFNRYTLPVGQEILPLGNEFEVDGAMKVFINGALADKDVDYQEISAGNGYGSSIKFLAPPTTIPYSVAVDFGVNAITDHNSIGAIEHLAGNILKIANDLAQFTGAPASDYYTASPSDTERRVFGDLILGYKKRIEELESFALGNVRRIVKTFSSGTTWYEVFNDGWVRQGSRFASGVQTARVIAFSVPYQDTNYNVAGNPIVTSATGDSIFVWNPTLAASFTVYTSWGCSWFAEGYGNSAAVQALGATPNY